MPPPKCPTCRGPTRASSVSVRAEQRTIAYVCDSCGHRWDVTGPVFLARTVRGEPSSREVPGAVAASVIATRPQGLNGSVLLGPWAYFAMCPSCHRTGKAQDWTIAARHTTIWYACPNCKRSWEVTGTENALPEKPRGA